MTPLKENNEGDAFASPVFVAEEQLLLLAALLFLTTFFLCCHVSILPFHFSWMRSKKPRLMNV
jgi:hypothetical protein